MAALYDDHLLISSFHYVRAKSSKLKKHSIVTSPVQPEASVEHFDTSAPMGATIGSTVVPGDTNTKDNDQPSITALPPTLNSEANVPKDEAATVCAC